LFQITALTRLVHRGKVKVSEKIKNGGSQKKYGRGILFIEDIFWKTQLSKKMVFFLGNRFFL